MKTILTLTLVIALTLSISLSYAQSNTERLNTVVTNTQSIIDTLQSIVDTIAGLPAQIETILADTNTKIDAGFNNTSIFLNGIRTDVTSIETKLDTVSTSTTGISSQISSFESTLATLLVNSQANKQTISDVTSLMAALNDNIDTVRTEIAAQDIASLSNNVDSLRLKLNTETDSINIRLAAIESALEELTDTPTTTTLGIDDGLIKASTKIEITAYTYKKENRPVGNAYELDFGFLCSGPIFIESVGTDVKRTSNPIIPTPTPGLTTPANYLRVDGEYLYNSRLESTVGIYTVFINDEDFEDQIKRLSPGEKLRFTSVQHESGTQIADSSSGNFGFKYVVTVNYIKSAPTTCSFDISQEVTLPKRDSLIIVTAKADPQLGQFEEIITCGNNPVEIQNIQLLATSAVTEAFVAAGLAKLDLYFDGASDSTADVTIMIHQNGTLADHTYPLRFDGDLKLAGNVPGNTNAVITVEYATVSGGLCTRQ